MATCTNPSGNSKGRPLGTHCRRRHDQRIFRRRTRSGSPYCVACKRSRTRKYHRLPKCSAQMHSLLRDGMALDIPTEAGREWQQRVFWFFGRVEARLKGAATDEA